MTQSPTMKEVERLLDAFDVAAHNDTACYGNDANHRASKRAARTAILDYIRTLVAGRSAAVGKAVEALEEARRAFWSAHLTGLPLRREFLDAFIPQLDAALASLRSEPVEVELPPLPESVAHMHSSGEVCTDRRPDAPVSWPVSLYTADQLRERDRQWAEALKAAGMEIKVKENRG